MLLLLLLLAGSAANRTSSSTPATALAAGTYCWSFFLAVGLFPRIKTASCVRRGDEAGLLSVTPAEAVAAAVVATAAAERLRPLRGIAGFARTAAGGPHPSPLLGHKRKVRDVWCGLMRGRVNIMPAGLEYYFVLIV